MIEITYYEKKTLRLRPDQLLDLDAKVRQELERGDDEPILIHDILLLGCKHGLGVRLPDAENIEPDDNCGPITATHLGHTRAELEEWVASQEAEYMDDVPDIFEELEARGLQGDDIM